MILVMVGTIRLPFERFTQGLGQWRQLNPKERLVVQYGHTLSLLTIKPAEHFQFIPFDRVNTLMKEARLVIVQGGEGSVIQALRLATRPPIVVPRDSRYKEHVDDQQLQIVAELARRKLAVISEPNKLKETMANYPHLSHGLENYGSGGDSKAVANQLHQYIRQYFAF